MNAGYSIFLFLFTFGVVCGGVNSLGLWSTAKLPQQDFSVSMQQINESTSSIKDSSALNFFTQWELLWKFISIILMGFLACFSLAAVFYACGFPVGFVGAALLTMIQTPATIVMLFFFYEQLTGRSVE